MSMAIFEALDQKDIKTARILLEAEAKALAEGPSEERFWHQNTWGYLHLAEGNPTQALPLYEANLTLATALADVKLIHVARHQLGMLFREMGYYDDALSHFFEERDYLEAHLAEDALAHSANAYEIGYLSFLQGNLVMAELDMQKALALAEKAADAIAQACAHRGLGEIKRSLRHFDKAYQLFEQAGDRIGASEVRALMAKAGL